MSHLFRFSELIHLQVSFQHLNRMPCPFTVVSNINQTGKKSTKPEIRGLFEVPASKKLSKGIPYMSVLSVSMQHELIQEYV